MNERKELLAYCGFYCGDCLGHTGVIADASANLKTVLERYKFGRTAECVFPEKLADYNAFYEMLGFMSGLKCPAICREREDGAVSCEVRKCCMDNGFHACYECGDLETCDRLKSLHERLHYETSLENLRSIAEMGLEAWLDKGKRHCYWDEEDRRP